MSIKKPSAVDSPYVTTSTTPTVLNSAPGVQKAVQTAVQVAADQATIDATVAVPNRSYYANGQTAIDSLITTSRTGVFAGANVTLQVTEEKYITYNQNFTGNGTVGGSNGQIQFNNDGSFDGSSNLTFNGANLAVGGTINGSQVSITGSITGGNLLTAGQVSAVGNITGNYFIGNGSQLTGINAGSSNKIFNGNSYANIANASGNLVVSANGNTWTFATDGTTQFPANIILAPEGYPITVKTTNGNAYARFEAGADYAQIGLQDDTTGAYQAWTYLETDMANVNTPSAAVILKPGDTGDEVRWTYNADGSFAPPTQASNQRTGSGLTLKIGDTDNQAIITGPAPVEGSYDNAPRLVVAGQDGVNAGEGGDIYLWAGRSGPNAGGQGGGDIKIDAGEAINGAQGGTIKIRGGYSGAGAGGFVEIYAGDGNYGAPVDIRSGQGNSAANSASVTVSTPYGGQWNFDNYGKITLPNGASLNDTSGDSVAFGQNAGADSQQQHAVAIGLNAGREYQGEDSIAIGFDAGYYNQGRGVAIGYRAGQGTNQSIPVSATYGGSGPATTYVSGDGNPSLVLNSVADVVAYSQWVTGNNIPSNTYVTNIYPGEDRIDISQPPTAALSPGDTITFIGSNIGVASTSSLVAGARVLGTSIPSGTYINSILGPNNIEISQRPSAPLVDAAYLEFYIGQGEYATAIGYNAGIQYQDVNAVAVGRSAGTNHQGANTVAVGYVAGAYSQSANAVAIGAFAGAQTQGINTVAIGYHTAANIQGASAVAIGEDAGSNTQGANAVAIGSAAGFTGQGATAISIGLNAGRATQGNAAVALGLQAGYDTQGANAVAIGYTAGLSAQGNVAIAIGQNAGRTTQGTAAVAMGWNAGNTNQGNAAVAIGEDAGFTNQGEYSVAIGYQAGYSGQGNNSIVLNASGDQINGITANSFTVKPIRNAATGNVLYYDQQSGEITFNIGGNVIYNGTSNVSIPTANGNVTINANTSQWNFGTTGNTTFPNGAIFTGYDFYAAANSYIELAGDTGNTYMGVSNTVAFIQTDWGGAQNQWTFDANGNLTTPGVSGNISGANVVSANIFSATGNVISGNVLTAGLISATANITGGNITTAGVLKISGASSYIDVAGTGFIQNGGTGELQISSVASKPVWINTNAGSKLWTFGIDGNLALPAGGAVSGTGNITGGNILTGGLVSATGNITAANFFGNGSTLSNVATRVTGSWTLAAGTNTVSFSVPLNGTYSIWVNGNIPNGIVTYTATVVITNTNVPVVGSSYGWYYAAGNALVLTAIPTQIVGTVNNISNAVVVTTTANVFEFGITNNSGNSAVVNYGYTKIG